MVQSPPPPPPTSHNHNKVSHQVYIKAVLSQYINDQQQRSNMTILWDGGGSDYHSEEILNEVHCRVTSLGDHVTSSVGL